MSCRFYWPVLRCPSLAGFGCPPRHKTPSVGEFLEEHKNVALHFTPTYSSWLNQVEIWFSKLERDVITRGIFTSVSDLRRKIMRYIRLYGKTAKPFRWKYADPTRRIKPW
jgi:transposase